MYLACIGVALPKQTSWEGATSLRAIRFKLELVKGYCYTTHSKEWNKLSYTQYQTNVVRMFGCLWVGWLLITWPLHCEMLKNQAEKETLPNPTLTAINIATIMLPFILSWYFIIHITWITVTRFISSPGRRIGLVTRDHLVARRHIMTNQRCFTQL